MGGDSTVVGLDTHKAAIHVAMLLPGATEPVQWQLANEPAAVRQLLRKLRRATDGEVRCCYEAGPCGYALQRQLEAAGVSCTVIAPSLIPVKPGERIKTDRRDARELAELFRAGLLTAVAPPSAGGADAGSAAGGGGAGGALSRAGRLAAVLSRDRHRHRGDPARRTPRLPAVHHAAGPHGLPGARAERALQRRGAAPRKHHEGGQSPRAPAADRSRVA